MWRERKINDGIIYVGFCNSYKEVFDEVKNKEKNCMQKV